MDRFLRLLNLRRSEAPRLALAALIFLLVAVNDAIVKSVSAGVFNIRAGVERLPEMYTWIALVFSATMVLLSWLTNRFPRQRLLFGLLAFLGVVLLVNTVALWAQHQGMADLAGTGFYPFLFVSSEIARNLAGFQVWIAAGGICYSSRAKVLFPLLAASTTLGDIAGGFLVRALGAVLHSHEVYGLSVVNTVVVIALMRPLIRRYYVTSSDGGTDGGASLAENLRYFGRSSYLRLLFVLSLSLYGLYTAIHYGFNVVARQYYPGEGDITAFFGLFFGMAGVATLFATTLLLRHILRWLGVGSIYLWVCLAHAGMAGALVAVFGDWLPLPVVAVIFVFNLLNYVLLDSIIAPSYQVLMKLVPERHSDGTRMIMEGGFMLVGGLLGAGITALHAHGLLSLGQLFGLLLAIAAVMTAAGWRLRHSHREVLVRAVREQSVGLDDEEAMESVRQALSHSGDYARSLLLHQDDGVREMGIELLRQSPAVAAEVALPIVTHENPRIRASALDSLSAAGVGDPVLTEGLAALDDEDAEVRLAAAALVGRALEAGDERGMAPAREGEDQEAARAAVIEAVAPRLVPDAATPALQAELLYVLERLEDPGTETARQLMLESLLEAQEVDEVTAGINTVARLGQVAGYPQILRHLGHAHPAVREAATRAVSAVGDDETVASLADQLTDPDPDVVAAAIDGLGQIDLESHGQALLERLGTSAPKEWLGLLTTLAGREDDAITASLMEACRGRLLEANRHLIAADILGRGEPSPAAELLISQVQSECATIQSGAIHLLGHLGDVDVVGDLVERLGETDPAARENAIELLENIGDRALMEMLLPLLTDDKDERVRAAIELTGWDGKDADGSVIHLLGSRDPWTQMAATWAALSMSKPALLSHLPRDVDERVTELIDLATTGGSTMSTQDQPLTSMEKITFLKESPFFAALPLEELYHVALSTQEETVSAGTTVIKQGTLGDKMYMVVSGQMEVRRMAGEDDTEGQQIAVTGAKQVFGDMALLDDEPRSASVIALEDSHLLSLQRGDLERILRRYSSIAFSMMRILSRRLRNSMAA